MLRSMVTCTHFMTRLKLPNVLYMYARIIHLSFKKFDIPELYTTNPWAPVARLKARSWFTSLLPNRSLHKSERDCS